MAADADEHAAGEPGAPADSGAGIVTLAFAGTGVFLAVATIATLLPDEAARPAAVVDGVLFAVGVGAFGWAYARAVSRSRTEDISVGGLFFLAGDAAPRVVRARLLGAVVVQAAIAIVSASIRPYTAVAFGILVPMFGMGLTALWGARYGRYPARADRAASSEP